MGIDKEKPYYSNIREDIYHLSIDCAFSTVLEIGGGNFGTLKKLSGIVNVESAVGVDPYCDSFISGNLRLYSGDVLSPEIDAILGDEKFDLIIAADVIEHIVDTDSFFRFCNDRLAINGRLIISVPNIRQLPALYNIFIKGSFPRLSSGLFDDTHLRWFCRKDLVNISSRHGFYSDNHEYVGRFAIKSPFFGFYNEFVALQNIFVLRKV